MLIRVESGINLWYNTISNLPDACKVLAPLLGHRIGCNLVL